MLLCPGDVVTLQEGDVKGKGLISLNGDLHNAVSTLLGECTIVDRVVSVKTPYQRYLGNVDDVIVGRVVEVGDGRWVIDYGGMIPGHLLIGSVMMKDSVQRRRTDEDRLGMKEIFNVGDLLACEVQKLTETGEALMHMRSSRFGLLTHGQLVKVPSYLIPRQSSHIVQIFDDVQVVLGCNGWIWVGFSTQSASASQGLNYSQVERSVRDVSRATRERIVGVSIAIKSLVQDSQLLTHKSILGAVSSTS